MTARAATPGSKTNTAQVASAAQYDPVITNNSASVAVNPVLPPQADLSVGQTVDNSTPALGTDVNFTVTVTDQGINDATGVSLSDLLPAGLTFVSASVSQGGYNSATGVWTVGSVLNGNTATLTIRATVTSATPSLKTNTASVLGLDQIDPDTSNNSASASITTPTPLVSDLQLLAGVDDNSPIAGETIHFTLSLKNLGIDNATGVKVTDLLPPGLTFAGATPSQGSYDSATGIWTVGSLANGATVTLSLAAVVASAVAKTDAAAITAADQLDSDPSNNSASVSVLPQQADLFVTKSVNNPTPTVGTSVTFTIKVSNLGPNTATNVLLSDVMPAGFTSIVATPSQGSYNPATGVWTVGSVLNGTFATLTIQATVATAGTKTNTAQIASADQFDLVTTNNSASAAVNPVLPPQADLNVTQTVDNSTPAVGTDVNFTITVTNQGPNDATGVTLSDLLPAGLTFVAASASQGGYSNLTGFWSVGPLLNGDSVTLVIQATVALATPSLKINTASVFSLGEIDPVVTNNSASVSINTPTPLVADLQLLAAVDNATPPAGGTVNITLTLNNLGPDNATGVQVTDLLPLGLSFVSMTPSQGTYNSSTGLWDVGSLANGASSTLVLTVAVTSTISATDVATIIAADQFDSNPTNNTALVTITPQRADLAVTKTVDDPTPIEGEIIHYTVTVSDAVGPNAASGVKVQDLLPAGVTFVSATASQGTYDPASGGWLVGSLSLGGSATLIVAARVDAGTYNVLGTPIINLATLAAADQIDLNPFNNYATAPVVVRASADVGVNARVDNPTPSPGDVVNITLTVTNNGPQATTGVLLATSLPAGLTFVSSSASQGLYTAGLGTWIIGILPAGGSATLTVTAQVDGSAGGQTLTFASSIQASALPDSNTANNSTSAQIVVVAPADLVVTAIAPTAPAIAGQDVTYTFVVTNKGPSDATAVTLTHTLPANTTLRSVSGPGGWAVSSPLAGNSGTLTMSAGTLAAGASATFTVTVHVDPNTVDQTILPVVASVSAASPDPDPSNNHATSPLSVRQTLPTDVFPVSSSATTVGASTRSLFTIPPPSLIQVLDPTSISLDDFGAGTSTRRGGSGAENDADLVALLLTQVQDAGASDGTDRLRAIEQVFLDLPFALRQLSRVVSSGTILGFVFEDGNGNGKLDSGEGGLEGFRVFIDVNRDGQYDDSCPVATTDASGQFKFEGLAPGTYTVRPIQSRHYVVTAPDEAVAHVVLRSEGGATVVFGCRPKRTRPKLIRSVSDATPVPAADEVKPILLTGTATAAPAALAELPKPTTRTREPVIERSEDESLTVASSQMQWWLPLALAGFLAVECQPVEKKNRTTKVRRRR